MRWKRTILLVGAWILGWLTLAILEPAKRGWVFLAYILWLIAPLFAFVVYQIVAFVLAVREGYTEAEREDRIRRGLCLTCGYNLRGNTSNVCPECGKVIAM